MGVPFVPVRGLYGSDIAGTRDDFKVIDDPYEPGKVVMIAPALRPDVYLVHGAVADEAGNVITTDQGHNDLLAAQASRKTLATVEELSPVLLTPATRPGWTFIPAIYVTAVALAPGGALPTGFGGLYPAADDHLRAYAHAGQSDEAFKGYLEQHVLGGAE